MRMQRAEHDEGVALVLAISFMLVSLIILSTLAACVFAHIRQSERFVSFKDCFHGIEYALAESLLELESGEDGSIGVGGWLKSSPANARPKAPAFDEEGVEALRIPSTPRVEYFAVALDWSSDGHDNTGNGITDGADEKGLYSIHAFARCNGVVRGAEVVLRRSDGGFLQVSWREVAPSQMKRR